jgi:hypothetical protein
MKGISMHIRSLAGMALAGACCAGLAACTAATSSGPINTVTTPAVGKPAAPDSVEAALAHMALYPYTILGQADNDPLAPGESDTALGIACVAQAGYPGAGDSLGVSVRATFVGLGIAQDWGAWGYVGAADARQHGFLAPPGKALQELGVDASPQIPSSLPTQEMDAVQKCSTIKFDFLNDTFNGPLAGIAAIATDISKDVADDPAVKSASTAWVACMAKNGYHYASPQAAGKAQMATISGGTGQINSGTISPSVNSAQIAAAVTDASCTSSSDLGGIYFAVEASYDQQVVSANQTALAAAVQEFRSAYAKEISALPHLLATTKANPFPNGGKKVPSEGGPGSTSSPSCEGGPSSENAC